MDTSQLEENIFSALISDSQLMELLPNSDCSIFHLKAPSVYPDYPIIVFSPISDVPILHGDNSENLRRITFRFHIISDNSSYPPIYNAVKRIMSDLGFSRVQSTPFLDEDNKFMLISDFKITIGV